MNSKGLAVVVLAAGKGRRMKSSLAKVLQPLKNKPLLNYIIENQLDIKTTFKLLNDQSLSFEGIDGKFSFENNLIKRNLNILQIKDGKALLIK